MTEPTEVIGSNLSCWLNLQISCGVGGQKLLGGGNSNIFGIFTLTWGRFPFPLIFFHGLETTNQKKRSWKFQTKKIVEFSAARRGCYGLTSSTNREKVLCVRCRWFQNPRVGKSVRKFGGGHVYV